MRSIVPVLVLALLGCDRAPESAAPAKSEQPAPAPAAAPAPAPPPLAKETSALAGSPALAHVPNTASGVVVCASLARLETELLGRPLAAVLEQLGAGKLAGLDPAAPVGFAWLDDGVRGWILFGGVGDARALRASVGKGRLLVRGTLALVASDGDLLRRLGKLDPAASLARHAPFTDVVARLDHGALLAWWGTGVRARKPVVGAAGLSIDGSIVRVKIVDAPPIPFARLDFNPRSAALLDAHAFSGLGLMSSSKEVTALHAERSALRDEAAPLERALDAARWRVIDDALASVGGLTGAESTWTTPAAGWVPTRVAAWLDAVPDARVALAALSVRRTALDRKIDAAERRAMSSVFGSIEGLDAGLSELNVYGGLGDSFGSRGLDDANGLGRSGGSGEGSIGLGTVGTIGHGSGYGRLGGGASRLVSTVTLDPASGATVRAHLQRRLSALRFCYERELLARPELRGDVKIELGWQADGTITRVQVSGAPSATIETCLEAQIRRSVVVARNPGTAAVERATLHLAPAPKPTPKPTP